MLMDSSKDLGSDGRENLRRNGDLDLVVLAFHTYHLLSFDCLA